MSRHIYSTTTDDGKSVKVVMGYDRPLNYLFMTVEELSPPEAAPTEDDDQDSPYLYSNMDDLCAGLEIQEIEYFLDILKDLQISIPEPMIAHIQEDQVNKVGNLIKDWTEE